VHSRSRCGTIAFTLSRRKGGMMEEVLTQIAQYFLWAVLYA
jgi:hypothetical protein